MVSSNTHIKPFLQVQLLEKCVRKFHVRNVGSYVCKFHWKLKHGSRISNDIALSEGQASGDKKCLEKGSPMMSVTPNTGVVLPGENKQVTMIYQPKSLNKLHHCRLIMDVSINSLR